MSQTTMEATASHSAARWNWHPALPIECAPVFTLPPQPARAARWFFSVGFLGSYLLPYVALSLAVWFLAHPDVARSTHLEPGWILAIFVRNLALMLLIAGALHLYFHGYCRQGTTHRFEARDLGRDDPRFFRRDQVIDNMAWSCLSGVPLWTAFEVAFMWGYANGALPMVTWEDSPYWFVALFVLIPFWQTVHFYLIHKPLHWRLLYRTVHAIHHRNVVIGPWSGISMHPVEHALYFSSVLIHLVVPSHPVHVIFHLLFLVFGAVQSHSGFQDLLWRGRAVFALGDFFHQLHHRHFTCNYGADYVPLDRWFGSFHDGTAAAARRLSVGRITPAG
ncbi:MAG: sterol desaturase family protein [Alphaproteobacteria bacterium]|nr:sterol desaturase family protein [Alphaproteobacteria bacterium]